MALAAALRMLDLFSWRLVLSGLFGTSTNRVCGPKSFSASGVEVPCDESDTISKKQHVSVNKGNASRYTDILDGDSKNFAYNNRIAALRAVEFPQLADGGLYLDHAGTTVPSRSLVSAFAELSLGKLLGNPHSGSAGWASQAAVQEVEDARFKALRWFNADPKDFDLVFVANATAGIKLVGEVFRGWMMTDSGVKPGGKEHRSVSFLYHADAHTSIIGLREELTTPECDQTRCLQDDGEVNDWLRNIDDRDALEDVANRSTVSLFAYPAQSNMNGRRLPLQWLSAARSKGVLTLLDAASLVSTAPLDLSDPLSSPDFTVVSFYKIFGMPDLGALIVKKSAAPLLSYKSYFGGGSVEMVSVRGEQWHIRKQNSIHETLEDGTLPVHNISMLSCAFNTFTMLFVDIRHSATHTRWLSDQLCKRMEDLRHWNGTPVCKIYGLRGKYEHGPILAFTLKDSRGNWISNFEFEKLAATHKIQVRTGSVCNPGGIAGALNLSPWEMRANFSAGQRCGGDNDVMNGKPTGIIRVSLGAMSILEDIQRFLAFIQEFYVESHDVSNNVSGNDVSTLMSTFYVETITIFPIKSCAGWIVPPETAWSVHAEGLAWDREWCLVHQGTQAALSQKKYTRMALLKPKIDLQMGKLFVSYTGPLPPGANIPNEISVPLSMDPSLHIKQGMLFCASTVCGDEVKTHVYASQAVHDFFSTIIGTPCQLARLPPSSMSSSRHARPHLKGSNLDGKVPLLLSNESPISIISRSSLNLLNETIKSKSPSDQAVPAAVFRANIVISENRASDSGFEQPWAEDCWQAISIGPDRNSTCDITADIDALRHRHPVVMNILGPCRRCQMVCIDQESGERNCTGEPFATLAKIRRRDGKVWFGMHAAMDESIREGRIMVGDKVYQSRQD